MRSITRGQWAEELACKFLQRAGLKLVERNFRCSGGEIDLVMRDQRTLVFVEVRYRRQQRFGGAAASINQRKQQRITLAASLYLQRQPANSRQPRCRFDVVLLSGDVKDTDTQPAAIEWIKQAFGF